MATANIRPWHPAAAFVPLLFWFGLRPLPQFGLRPLPQSSSPFALQVQETKHSPSKDSPPKRSPRRDSPRSRAHAVELSKGTREPAAAQVVGRSEWELPAAISVCDATAGYAVQW